MGSLVCQRIPDRMMGIGDHSGPDETERNGQTTPAFDASKDIFAEDRPKQTACTSDSKFILGIYGFDLIIKIPARGSDFSEIYLDGVNVRAPLLKERPDDRVGEVIAEIVVSREAKMDCANCGH